MMWMPARLAISSSKIGHDLLQLVQQLLRAADAEGRDQQRAAVAEGVLADGLQALAPALAVFVPTVAVGALFSMTRMLVRAGLWRAGRCGV